MSYIVGISYYMYTKPQLQMIGHCTPCCSTTAGAWLTSDGVHVDQPTVVTMGYALIDKLENVVPFTLASKNRGFSKIANLRWKLLSNFLKTTKNLTRKTLLRSGFFLNSA